ncbi:MAG: MFS transporter [Amphritea sp.]
MDMNVAKSDVTQIRVEASESSITLAIGLLAFTMFVIVTSEFVVVGLLPVMATDLNVPLSDTGWFVTWFALAASLLGPPLAVFAGRYNPRDFLIASTIAFATGNLAIALAPHYYIVIATRVLQGSILPAIVSVAAVEAVRLAGAEREGWAISRVNLGVAATTILGVPASAIAADKVGWPASFASLALLGLISAGLIALWFPRVSMGIATQSSMLTEVSLLWRPSFLIQLLLSCVLFTGMFAGYTYIAALLGTLANIDGATIGWVLMGFGLAGVLGNWVSGRVVDRDPIAASAWVSFALAIAMAAVASAGKSLFGLIFVVGLWGSAHLAAFVVSQIRVMQAGRGAEAFALSLNISACNLGIGFGATLGGIAVTHYSVEAAGYFGAAAAAVAFLITIVMIVDRSRDLDAA